MSFPILTLLVFRGAFSIVKRCVNRKNGEEYAAKIINKRRLTARGRAKLI